MTSNKKNGKPAKKRKQGKKELNKKGSEKEGSDMDVFTSIEKAPANTEKSRNLEKLSQQNVAPLVSVNTNTSNRKTNSSQKSNDDVKENVKIVVESKEKVSSHQNIPTVPILPVIQNAETNKTEQMHPSSDNTKRKKYNVEYMLSLQHEPQCKVVVKLNSELPLLKTQMGPPKNASQNGYSGTMFQPAFMHQPPSRSSMSGRKNSQQGMKRDRPNQIHVSLSLKDDVPLRSSKDAWKPTRLNADVKNLDQEEKKSEELYKTVRGILNKLTPENFPKLIVKIKTLPIDTAARLKGVIDLIFQKAIDEPGFCKWYAQMCHVMQGLSVPDESQQNQSFRTVLINKCQHQFESDKADELDAEKRQKEIDKCTDPEKKKELQLLFEEIERKIRRKSVGNCRFIGELFKLQMLTAKIMLRCVSTLVSQIEEESLECLCKLLTTIGRDLEQKSPTELEKYFTKMQEISEKKQYKVSSRIRFMLQDVIDLKKNNWIPRREMDNPKTIEQIDQEIEKKDHDSKMANLLPRKTYDDNYNNRSRDFKKTSRNDNKSIDDWHMVQSKGNSYTKNYKFDSSKFKGISTVITPDATECFGAPAVFNTWRHGVQSANTKPGEKKNPGTLYSSMSLPSRNMPNKLTPSNSSEKPRPFPPMQREGNNETGKMSRSSSSQSVNPVSRESSVQRTAPSQEPAPLSRDDISKYCKTILNEYFLNNDLKDSIADFEERFACGGRVNSSQIIDVIEAFINTITDQPKLANHCGKLLAALLQKKIISQEHIINALSNIVNFAEDIIVDCPLLWTYLGDTLHPLFIEDCLSYSEFETAFVDKLPDQQNGPLLKAVTKLLNSSKNEKSRNSVDAEQRRIFKFLLEKLNSEAFENITKWIDENVENSRNNPTLVVALTKAICEFCCQKLEATGGHNVEKEGSKEFNELFLKYSKFFKLYIENQEELEMQCLYAVQNYAREKNYPRGFLLQMFLSLYENKSISYESFITWKKNNEGPIRNEATVGVAMLSLQSFFNFLTDSMAS